ncbi:receptor-like serine/threonine-protein kinase At4g25390 [Gastrolobium bilobum]|uniref:receptor-like serine/threonine-protein kinase At4g25390 n=1 Tax=Gastrolobium bilobum TaxID=150636 RepID=UPI002AB29615|nr:receptor-like serine/threonine-protein kinase At4g25390 [Gastrolobium bilobum]
MPSRQLLQSPPSTAFLSNTYPPPPPPTPQTQPPHTHHHRHHHLLTPLIAATASAFSLLLLAFICHRTLTRKRTTPFSSSDTDSKPPHRFSYALLRRATNSFSSRLGHGGFGTVFAGTLPPPARKPIAVKLMDSTSHQGEREFHNELFFASRLRSLHVVAAVGFSSDPKRRRFLLVYELMHNGNLQDALLHRKSPELLDWKKRFAIVLDIARGVQYLHSCDPPIIHGDIKPSNILLDRNFSAKIGDFGLARLKSEPLQFEIEVLDDDSIADDDDEEKKKKKKKEEELECDVGGVVFDDCGSIESVHTVFFDSGSLGVEQSPPQLEKSPESIVAAVASPETALATVASSPGFDKFSVQSEKDVVGGVKKSGKGLRSNSVRELWWMQDNDEVAASASASTPTVSESKKVKEYVMEWIGREVNKESPKSEWVGAKIMETEKKKSKKHQLEWWESMDELKVGGVVKKEKRRPAREWWKENSEEIAKKKKKKKKNKKSVNNDDNGDDWWVSDDALYGDKIMTKSRSRNNRGNMDWWLDGLSGQLWRARRNSFDSASGEIPKSGGVSSTPSMRGTVCYVAPEYGCGEDVSEKCDVYSFGVLLLVIISGRRPLQVNGSPMSEFQRANLLSWTRHCARNGKLIELVDQSIQSLDKEQALLCIKVALLCLLKSPARRPSLMEVVGMLSGELEPPQLPVEYSPSTPSRFPFKSRKKGR